ncbi:MAG: hypothetical protein H7Y32_07530 [Chloroflexales bacterium]|nr:hypothetical protein [Chloroflexales bacterium]
MRITLAVLACCIALSGCLLVSGERVANDVQSSGGTLSASFVSAEGNADRALDVGPGVREVQIVATIDVESGSLGIDLLQPDGSVLFSIDGRPNDRVTRSGSVPLDDQGRLRYRVRATGARNGSYQILYQAQ